MEANDGLEPSMNNSIVSDLNMYTEHGYSIKSYLMTCQFIYLDMKTH